MDSILSLMANAAAYCLVTLIGLWMLSIVMGVVASIGYGGYVLLIKVFGGKK